MAIELTTAKAVTLQSVQNLLVSKHKKRTVLII